MNGGITLVSKMPLLTKIVHIKFQFLTHSLMEIISLTDFLKDLYSAAIVVTCQSCDLIYPDHFDRHRWKISLIFSLWS